MFSHTGTLFPTVSLSTLNIFGNDSNVYQYNLQQFANLETALTASGKLTIKVPARSTDSNTMMADHNTLEEQPQQSPGPSPVNWQDWNEADNSEDMYLIDENNATSDQQHGSESVNRPKLDDDRDKQGSIIYIITVRGHIH
ncbi:hypothetical protein BDN67DRAFT_985496 [Paxillus ammoniavirescens]|nr:hypothetical protein BDN67DRAFT_985496 [Paxillus ammoniavirescens]